MTELYYQKEAMPQNTQAQSEISNGMKEMVLNLLVKLQLLVLIILTSKLRQADYQFIMTSY